MRRLLALSVLLGLLIPAVHAAPLEVEARVDRTRAAMGQTLRLEIDLSLEPGRPFEPPPAESLEFPPFEVRDAVMTREPSAGGRERLRYTVRLAGFEVGKLTIPAVSFEVGGKTVKTAPIQVELTGAVPRPDDRAGEIRDLKPPSFLPIPPVLYLVAALAALALLFLLWRAVRWLLRRRGPTPDEDVPLHVWALRELERLQQEPWLGEGRHKEFYQRLTDIVRVYLARRFGVPAMERTTPELAQDLKRLDLDHATYRALRKLFDEADLVKFAMYRPPVEDALEQVGQARVVVERTQPREEERP
ncbi:MAG: BatD family protein [Armatimonadetes bacterium]|nr:BatD family protein [Armatimonadota bacterium]